MAKIHWQLISCSKYSCTDFHSEDELIGEAVKGLKPSPTMLPDMIRSMVCTCKIRGIQTPHFSAGRCPSAVASLLKDVFQRKDAERCPNLPKSNSRNNCDSVLGIYKLFENPKLPGSFVFSRLPSNRQGHRETKLKQGCHTTQGCPWRMRGWASVWLHQSSWKLQKWQEPKAEIHNDSMYINVYIYTYIHTATLRFRGLLLQQPPLQEILACLLSPRPTSKSKRIQRFAQDHLHLVQGFQCSILGCTDDLWRSTWWSL